MTRKSTYPELRKRRTALLRGHWSETKASIFLRLKGYRILARNFRCKSGEIDMIGSRGDILAVVEVKRRSSASSAVDAVSPSSQHRIRNAADYWLMRNPDFAGFSMRFDIIADTGGFRLTHLENAF